LDLEQLVLRIKVMADQADQSIDDVKAGLTRLDEANRNSGDVAKQAGQQAAQAHKLGGQSAEAAAAQTAAAYAAVAAVATQAFRIIVDGIEKSIAAGNRYTAAITGLSSVAAGKGIGGQAMADALNSVVDQFFDASAAATSFKNLISRGYGLTEATKVINAFKNSAAFGRQASLELAQAVVSATEGIKNENSILVDNAGVTKNVSKMWEDYGKTIGVSVANMTKSQKIQAEYSGIMEETKFQIGDLAKLTGTLAGAQASVAMSGELLSRAYGEDMGPAVGIATAFWNGFLTTVRDTVGAFPGAAAGMTTTALAASVLVGILPAAATAWSVYGAKMLLAAKNATILGVAMGTAMPWLIGISAAVGLVVGIYTALSAAQRESAQAAADEVKAQQEKIKALASETAILEEMRDRYIELQEKKRLTYAETKELAGIEKDLEKQYGVTVSSLKGVAGAYDLVTLSVQGLIAVNEIQLQAQRLLDAANAEKAAKTAQDDAGNSKKELDELVAQREEYNRKMMALNFELAKAKLYTPTDPIDADANEALKASLSDSLAVYQGYLDELSPKITNEESIISRAGEAWGLYLTARAEAIKGAAKADAGTAGLAQTFMENVWGKESAAGFSDGEAAAVVQQLLDSFTDALDNTDISKAQTAVEGYYNRVLAGEILTGAEMNSFTGFYEQLQTGAQKIGAAFGLTAQQVQTALDGIYTEMEGYSGKVKTWYDKLQEFDASKFITKFQAGDTSDMDKATENAKKQSDAFKDLSGRFVESRNAVQDLQHMQEFWGDQTSKTFTDAKSAAEDYFGQEIEGQAEVKMLMEEEKGLREGLETQYYAQRDALSSSVTVLSQMRNAFQETYGAGSTEAAGLDVVITGMLRTLRDNMHAVDQSGNQVAATLQGTAMSAEQVAAAINKTGDAMHEIGIKQAAISGIQKLVAEAKKAQTAGKDFSSQWKQITAFLGNDFKGDLAAAGDALEGMADTSKSAMGIAAADLTSLETYVQSLISTTQQDMTISPQVRAVNLGPLQALLDLINAVRVANGQGKVSKGGGGGGQSKYAKDIATMEHEVELERLSLEKQLAQLEALEAKYVNRRGKSTLNLDDQRDLEKRIFDAQDEIRKKDLDAAYDALSQKKAMGELTVQQEIDGLEQIKAAHKLNAAELADIDERLYDTRESIRQDALQADLASINHKRAMGELTAQQEIDMLQAVADAHKLAGAELESIQEQIYTIQQQQQQETLDAQTDAIQTAYGKITQALKNRLQEEKDLELAALDDKIKALQDQTSKENEAGKAADYAEKLADKQRQLQLTKSARERRELQADIDEMVADEALRQLQAARQLEIDALKDQKTAVTDKYAQLMDEENIRQEALRVVMDNNLQTMTDLIASYGTPWSDAGAALVDQLTNGITGQKLAITDTLVDLGAWMSGIVKDQFAGLGSTTSGTKSVTVTINGLTIREEADVDKVAAIILDGINRAGN